MNQKDLTLFFVWCWLELLKKRESTRVACKKWRAAHPEYAKMRCKRWRAAHPGAMKAWRAANPEAAKAGQQKWRNRQKQNPWWRIRNALRVRIWEAIQSPARKSAKTLRLLGCSVPELRAHLAAKFQPGMTWDNYGEWHIDHIRPCARFDLTDPAQQRECFNFKNLQPLWAADNIRKGDTYNAA